MVCPGVLITLCNHPSHCIAMVGFIGLPWCRGVAMEDSFLSGPQRLHVASGCLKISTPRYTRWSYRCRVYQNSMAWGIGVILSSIFVEESDTWAGLLMLSAVSLAYGGCKWKLCEVGVASALFIEAPTTTTLSFQTSLHAPSWVMLVEVLRCRSQV